MRNTYANLRARLEAVRANGETIRTMAAIIFGDRIGLALFCIGLTVFALYWRIGFFINDNYTIANTLVAVSEGHLSLETLAYGDSFYTPGTYTANGQIYGRNYAQVVAALPALWGLQLLATVADPRVAVVALWSGCVLATSLLVGDVLNRRRAFAIGGSVLATALFLANASVATPLNSSWLAMIALQISTFAASALIGVLMYRLLTDMYGTRVGVFAGTATLLATPVGFWAGVPKRHAFTTLLAVATIYVLYRSRVASRDERAANLRALAYAFVGLSAWEHAPEALILFIALVAVDLPTARSNDPRTLTKIALVFVLSLVPFFVTNMLIAGNPIQPPRFLDAHGSNPESIVSKPNGSGGQSSVLSAVLQTTPLGDGLQVATIFASLVMNGLDTFANRPDKLYNTFLRSGYIERVVEGGAIEAINLTLLESMPLLALVAGVPALLASRWRSLRASIRTWLETPASTADLLVLAYAFLLTTIYIPRLPIHAQVTVRYLLALYPLLLYAGIRLPAVSNAIETSFATVVWTWSATVFVGTQLLYTYISLTALELGEALQLHALLGLVVALPLGIWSVVATLRGPRANPAIGGLTIGLAAGTGTVFLLLTGLAYFAYTGDFALPIADVVSDVLAF